MPSPCRAAVNQAPNVTLQQRIKYRLAVALLAAHQFDLAKLELLQLALTQRDTLIVTEANLLLGLTHIYQSNWTQSRAAFQRAAKLYPNHTALQRTLAAIDERLGALERKPDRKSPVLAKWLSTFVPGSGQVYAGRTWNGINALALNTGTTYLVARAFANESPRNAVLLMTSLWWRYYKGNRVRAEEAARVANERHRERIMSDLYLLLQEAAMNLPAAPLNVFWLEEARD